MANTENRNSNKENSKQNDNNTNNKDSNNNKDYQNFDNPCEEYLDSSNKYIKREKLGEGGHGVVYKVYDKDWGEFFAIKGLNKDKLNEEHTKDNNSFKKFFDSFAYEARISRQIKKNKITNNNIIEVMEIINDKQKICIKMDYIDGGTLGEWIEKHSLLRDCAFNSMLKYIIKFMKEILGALEKVHKHIPKVIHMDIKPSNILLTKKDNRAILTDFGIARAIYGDNKNTDGKKCPMTTAYASPEQEKGDCKLVDERSDIYSLGLVFYEALTGDLPNNKNDINIPSHYNPKLKQILTKILAYNKNYRYSNAEEVINELNILEEILEKNKNFVFIENGNFQRGNDKLRITDVMPQRDIKIDEFYMSKYPVTNEEFIEFLKDNEEYQDKFNINKLAENPSFPIVNVTWEEANEYCEWLNEQTKYFEVRLPTEAEWEKVAKGGKGFLYPWGNEYKDGYANINNFCKGVVDVKNFFTSKGEGKYDVYQMIGNIWEWCLDDYYEKFYEESENSNPKCENGGDKKVIRGGAFDTKDHRINCNIKDYRNKNEKYNNVGFRVVKKIK